MATRVFTGIRVLKDNGDVCTDASVAFYEAGTTTPLAVYSDRALTSSLGVTVSFGSLGIAPDIWVADTVSVKAVVTGTGVTQDTIDYLTVATSTATGETGADVSLGNGFTNGAFEGWAAGTSFSNISGDGDGDVIADGWYFTQPTAASNAVSRQTALGTQGRYGLRFGRPAASVVTNELRVWQMLSTGEAYRFRAQEVTVSVRVTAGANFSGTGLKIRLATGTAEGEDGDNISASTLTGHASPIDVTQTITTSTVRYEFTATLASGLKEIGIQFSYVPVGTAGANDWVQIEEAAIEIGAAATTFKYITEPLDFVRLSLTTGGRLVMATPFTDPGADVVFGWDDSAGTFIGYTLGGALSTSTTTLQVTAANILTQLLTVDGSGSGLDADLLDGQSSAYYLAASSYTAADVLAKLITVDGAASGLDADLLDGQSSAYYLAASSYTAADVLAKLITVDGAGSGLDADLLDGKTTGTSGNTVPLLDGANTWSANQAFSTYLDWILPTGNATGRISGRYNVQGTFHDALVLSDNYKWDTGAIDSASLGTAMVTIKAQSSGAGLVEFWTGAVNTAPTRRAYVDASGVYSDGALTLTTATGAQLGAANVFSATTNTFRVAADENLTFRAHLNLSDGIRLQSEDNAASVLKGLELRSTNLLATITGTAEISGGDLRITAAPTTLATNSAGFRGLGALNSQGTYTFVLGDAGLNCWHVSGTHAWTIPPNSSVAFPIGTAIHVFNESGTLTIVEGAGVALYKGDSSGFTSGTRTITAAAGATLWKISTNGWVIEGIFT